MKHHAVLSRFQQHLTLPPAPRPTPTWAKISLYHLQWRLHCPTRELQTSRIHDRWGLALSSPNAGLAKYPSMKSLTFWYLNKKEQQPLTPARVISFLHHFSPCHKESNMKARLLMSLLPSHWRLPLLVHNDFFSCSLKHRENPSRMGSLTFTENTLEKHGTFE